MNIKSRAIKLILFTLLATMLACGGGGGSGGTTTADPGDDGGNGGGQSALDMLAATMVNMNTYAVTNGSAVVNFDGVSVVTAFQDDYLAPATGSYTIVDNIITVTLGADVIVLTILSGDKETINAGVVIAGVAQQDAIFQRMATIDNGDNASDNINVGNLISKFFVDHAAVESILLPSTCDGNTADGVKLFNESTAINAIAITCKLHASGMLEIVGPGTIRTLYGVFAKNWDGSNLSQQLDVLEYILVQDADGFFPDGFIRTTNIAAATDLAVTGPVIDRILLRFNSSKVLTMRFSTTGLGSVADPLRADFYRYNPNTDILSQFRRKIVLGQVNLVTGSTAISYSRKNSDDTTLRYALNLGKRDGLSVTAILKTNNACFSSCPFQSWTKK